VAKIEAAVAARLDPDFLIIARTGGFRNEGFEEGIARLEAYRDAGADLVMALCREAELRPVAERLPDIPLAIITGLDHHTPAEWAELGWKLVIDSFTAQALAVDHTREAYRRFATDGTTGVDAGGMRLHRELVELCGLEPWLGIERATTERPAAGQPAVEQGEE
jgi:2-methylisocitrate lyase-like PEP mutase family enzyme